MLNIVIPMAGRGSRFANAGYAQPKPLIDVYGHPMIAYVVKNITPKRPHRFIFVCQKEHLEAFALADTLHSMCGECEIVTIDHITEGAACTVLLAKQFIDSQDPLMIANSDQYVDTDINRYLDAMGDRDGLIMTMPAEDPKWSYIRCDAQGLVTLVREKQVISHEATVGIYNYAHGADFVRYAEEMIAKDIRVGGEFYVAPVYNEMIAGGKRIGFHNVGSSMYGLGIPEDLKAFMETEISKSVFA
ncbi:MAG: glycosyltransferase family 2 protein [Clostridia bacterium]|nr:glycosyltransferase family 2 protein [Clostridia bacterium]MBR2287595.1 glycosyltransferase family 2 protein [Clostridia bacterium]